ncbi:MAG TPA: hypothetical protein VJJ79_00510 [Candidatus Nanoarchaeia archaeon]|nr:hypothetical protein [Candidatus Nanoarchaeia archaeon]
METKDERIKEILFPAIAVDIITGYDVYKEKQKGLNTTFTVNYLHANLEPTDAHRQELEEKIKEYGIHSILQSIRCQRLDRTAIYRLEYGWHADEYYDAEGNSITLDQVNELIKHESTVIGLSKQYNLQMGIDDKKTLDLLLNILRKHANLYVINKKTGKPVKYSSDNGLKQNRKHKIHDAWEIPIIGVETAKDIQLEGYRRVNKIFMDGFGDDIYTFVDKKWADTIKHPKKNLVYPTFKEYLEDTNISYSVSHSLVNNILVEWLNEARWKLLENAQRSLRIFK